MRTVYHARHLIDAHLVRLVLAEQGIEAFVAGEYLTGAVGQLPALDYVSVQVADCHWEQAVPLVRQIEADLAEARQALADWDGDGLPQPA